jgi:glucokinase
VDYVLAVDLGGTKIYSALVGSGDLIVKSDVRPTEAEFGQERVLDNIMAGIGAVAPLDALHGGKILGLGIGAPGPLDPCAGKVCYAPNLCWRDYNLRDVLQGRLGVPVFLENDANLAALGEHLYGAGQGHDDMVFITVSTGIGGGLILRGEIYDGAFGAAGEIGHLSVVPDGPACSCGGRGCLEALASGWAIGGQAQRLIAAGQGRRILAAAGGDAEAVGCPAIVQAAHDGDPEARELLAAAGRYLGQAIGNIANLLNPSLFVIGGGVATAAGRLLLEAAETAAGQRVFSALRCFLKIVPASLGARAGVLGAAAYAHHKLGSGKREVGCGQ